MERVRWALVSEWLVEDPWQFFLREGVVEWREIEERGGREGGNQHRWRPVWQQNGGNGRFFRLLPRVFWVELRPAESA